MLNKVILIGNIGKDPKISATKNGKEIASFSLATSENYKDKSGQRMTKSEWHNIVVYNEALVNVIKLYLKKGSKVYLEGSIANRKYTAKDGVEKYITEIVLSGFNSRLVMLDNKKEATDDTYNSSANVSAAQPDVDEDELPF